MEYTCSPHKSKKADMRSKSYGKWNPPFFLFPSFFLFFLFFSFLEDILACVIEATTKRSSRPLQRTTLSEELHSFSFECTLTCAISVQHYCIIALDVKTERLDGALIMASSTSVALMIHPRRFVNSRALMGCCGAPHQCPLGSVASYLIYADVRTLR